MVLKLISNPSPDSQLFALASLFILVSQVLLTSPLAAVPFSLPFSSCCRSLVGSFELLAGASQIREAFHDTPMLSAHYH
jgi:hypothetical protein